MTEGEDLLRELRKAQHEPPSDEARVEFDPRQLGAAIGVELDAITHSVLSHVGPDLGPVELDAERVAELVLHIYLAALTDPELIGLSGPEWRRTIAGRAFVAVSFPTEPTGEQELPLCPPGWS